MHGHGTLTLKDGNDYEGDWLDGINPIYDKELKGKEEEWNKQSFWEVAEKTKLGQEKKLRIFDEMSKHAFLLHTDFPEDL